MSRSVNLTFTPEQLPLLPFAVVIRSTHPGFQSCNKLQMIALTACAARSTHTTSHRVMKPYHGRCTGRYLHTCGPYRHRTRHLAPNLDRRPHIHRQNSIQVPTSHDTLPTTMHVGDVYLGLYICSSRTTAAAKTLDSRAADSYNS